MNVTKREADKMQTVYLLSGPAGVGKSTTSQALARCLNNSAYVSGDYVSHMHVNGRQKPWESKLELSLIWNNILSLTRNFILNEIDVVVDYVTFPDEAYWLRDKLKDLTDNVVYTVLWVDPETLLKRDQLRLPEHQMGERCLILMEEFKQSGLKNNNLLDTSQKSPDDIQQVIEEIMNNKQYRLAD
ncbi:AAA domain-containing protein [Paenibacillus tianmuensis]|uniref:AAA domain-containing protein n=1 Tax=Paenibacillus tianmuensis TaxID=624147 RepID=A0A1G4SCC5_9BACL|nr:AAA family ATPase [Paenibacillus tianmuensis]SCW66671.1 AAA domain-containing protein [Paenibacillus tianmuensis]